jgi:hypothetical protein
MLDKIKKGSTSSKYSNKLKKVETELSKYKALLNNQEKLLNVGSFFFFSAIITVIL